jgi:predicted signal transduction protein with EAL and GGDEF domain
LARVGGDEFAAVLNVTRNADARQEIAEVAERILAAVRGCSRVQSHHVSVSASIGISLFPEHTHDAAALIRLADTAMRKVKSQTGDAAGFYDLSASENDFRTSEIVAMIRSAIGNGGFRLMFQPMTDRDGFVSQIEALFRIDDSLLSIVPPDEIMDVAEQTGLIHEMGAWVLREACKQARAWHDEGYNVPIAVNVSPAQLEAPGFADQVLACFADAGLTARALVLEVIEDASVENAAGHDTLRSESALHDLRAAGVAVSLCEFGAGGSLTIRAGMPVDNLKIDGSLTARLLRNPKILEMVSQTMERARALGYRVIVDGIEEVPQRDLAREMGCDLFQGFLIAPPLEREDATQFLAGQFEPSLAEPQRKLA